MIYIYIIVGLLSFHNSIKSMNEKDLIIPFCYNGLGHTIQHNVIRQLDNPKIFGRTDKYNYALVKDMIRDNFAKAIKSNKSPQFLMSNYVPIILVDDDTRTRRYGILHYTFHAIDLYDTQAYNLAYATHQPFQRIRKKRYIAALQNKKSQLGLGVTGQERISKDLICVCEGEVKKNKFTLSDSKNNIKMTIYFDASLKMPLLLHFMTSFDGDRNKLEAELFKTDGCRLDVVADYLKIMLNVGSNQLFEMLFNYFITMYETLKTLKNKKVAPKAYNMVLRTYYELLFLADKHNKVIPFRILCLQVPEYIKDALVFQHKETFFETYYEKKDIKDLDKCTVLDFMLKDKYFNKNNIEFFKKGQKK